jgi:hypothetical protein
MLVSQGDRRAKQIGTAHVPAAQILSMASAAVYFIQSLAALDHRGVFRRAFLSGNELRLQSLPGEEKNNCKDGFVG